MNNQYPQTGPSVRKPSQAWSVPLKTLSSVAAFGSEFLANSRSIGSPVPSLPALSRRMASFVESPDAGIVVELGAGTGSITQALLRRGVKCDRLFCLDCSPTMIRTLRDRFPQLRYIVQGSAANLDSLLAEHLGRAPHPVRYIVSGLPLLSLPKTEVASIVSQVEKVLAPGGRLIQFTYNLRSVPHPALAHFDRVTSSIVWYNFPPARVHVYTPRNAR